MEDATTIATVISAIVAGLALLASIIFNHQTRKQYFESLKPLLSMSLFENGGFIFLSVKNTGLTEARNIKIEFDRMMDSGDRNSFDISPVFEKELQLFPEEMIQGPIALYGGNMCGLPAPSIYVKITYIYAKKKKARYERQVSFTQNVEMGKDIENSLLDISKRLNEISYSNNRMANYFEGRCLFKFDELNVMPKDSLFDDMKDAFQGKNKNKKRKNRR
jgi:hypothetical protein